MSHFCDRGGPLRREKCQVVRMPAGKGSEPGLGSRPARPFQVQTSPNRTVAGRPQRRSDPRDQITALISGHRNPRRGMQAKRCSDFATCSPPWLSGGNGHRGTRGSFLLGAREPSHGARAWHSVRLLASHLRRPGRRVDRFFDRRPGGCSYSQYGFFEDRGSFWEARSRALFLGT